MSQERWKIEVSRTSLLMLVVFFRPPVVTAQPSRPDGQYCPETQFIGLA
jgi:hypothetical protein